MDKANILMSNSNDLNDVYYENYPERAQRVLGPASSELRTINSGEMSQRKRQEKKFLMADE